MGLRLNNRRKPTPNKRPRPTQGLDPQRTAGIRRAFNAEVRRMLGSAAAEAAKMRGYPRSVTANVDRIDMPQIRKENWGDFLEFVKERTSLTQENEVDPETLRMVQSEWSQDRVDAIPMEKLQYPILVSDDGYVLDGNHRWIKAKQEQVKVKTLRIGLPVEKALDLMKAFPQAEFVGNSSSQDVERFEQWFADVMDRAVLQPSRSVIARYVDLAFRAGSGRVFDDFHSGRSRVGEPAGLREGMRKQFVEDLAGHPQTTVTLNSFCPTGKGGGVDPTCSPPRDVTSEDADGNNILRQDYSHEKGISLADIQRAEQGFVSRRSHDFKRDSEIVADLADRGFLKTTEPIGRGLAFATEAEADAYVDKISNGIVTSDTPSSFSTDPDVYNRFSAKLGAQVVPGTDRNAHGVVLEIRPNLRNRIRGVTLDYGESEFILPRGQRYSVSSVEKTKDANGFTITRVRLSEDKPITVNAFGFLGKAADKVRTITSRVYNDLKSVVQGIVSRGTRVVADAVEKNKEPSQVTRQVLEEVTKGLDGALTTAGDAVSRGYVAGQIAAMRQLGVKSVTPAVEWTVRRDNDGNISKTVCKLCRPLDGLVFTVDEAEGLFPRHPKCLPGDSLVLSRSEVSAASKRWFDGDLVVFKTASGRELSCTPNHPVLTDVGWVAAGRLNVGSHVVCDGGREWEGVVDDNRENAPASIHDVTEALRSSCQVTTSEVPLSAPDFHGDGGGSEVAVIWSDGKLGDRLDSSLSQQVGKDLLVGRRQAAKRLSPGSRATTLGLLRPRAAPGRCVSCGDLVGSLGVGHASPSKSLSVPASPYLNVSDSQRHPDGRPPHVVPTGDSLLGFPGDVTLNRVPERVSRPTGLVDFPPQEVEKDVERDAQLAREILQGATGPVYLDDVISVVVKKFSGHVYNLETGKGFYAANGIITHNCQCSLMIPTKYGVGRKIKSNTKDEIEDAIARSRGKAKSQQGWAKDIKISRVRPTRNQQVWSAPPEVVNAYSSIRTAAGLGLQQQEQSNGHGQ